METPRLQGSHRRTEANPETSDVLSGSIAGVRAVGLKIVVISGDLAGTAAKRRNFYLSLQRLLCDVIMLKCQR